MMLAFVFVILFTLPVEMVVLPRFYSHLFESVRGSAKALPGVFQDVGANIGRQSASGIMYTISIIWLVVVAAYLLKNTMEAYIVPSYTSFVRQKMFTGTIQKHSDNYKDIRVGEHVTRLMDVSRNMTDLLTWTLNDIIPLYIAVCALCVFLLSTNLAIGVVTTVGVLVHCVALFCSVNHNIALSARREKYYLEMSERIHDSFGNLMNVYINNMKAQEIVANNDTEARHKELLEKQYVNTRNVVAILSLITVLTFVVTIFVTYQQLLNRNISSVTFVSVWIILLLYLSNMMKLSDYIPHCVTKLGIIACSDKFLMGILKTNGNRVSKSEITAGHVSFEEVEFAYDGSDQPTLYEFNLEIRPNEKIAILGTSGSGKTTAMKLLNGMYTAQKGVVSIDGIDIATIPVEYLREQVNYVNQRTTLFNTNIIKNIQYGNNVSDERITEILDTYGLNSVYSKLKDGIYTNAGVYGGTLSLGMQKVTILMRGLMRGGKVVVLDEPLAGLDATTRQNVMRFMSDFCKEKTLIIITHDKEILPMVDRVVQFGDANHTENYVPPPPPPSPSPSIIEKLSFLFAAAAT
jgi:ABC-type multidrug transport system fused ATPase/permease subunit